MSTMGNGQKVAERLAANPFRGETPAQAAMAVTGAPEEHRYDKGLPASIWPQNAVAAPSEKPPMKINYRHDGSGKE